jgi:adenosylhomocysteine nucleosidase
MAWLMLASEAREFAGILRRAERVSRLSWPGIAFVREISWRAGRWLLAANGPGRDLAGRVLVANPGVEGLASIGFCGALDPALRIGDIVIGGDEPGGVAGRVKVPYRRGTILCVDRVAITSAEKRQLRESSGAAAIDMESSMVESKAREWGVPFWCARAVSDTATEDLPLDFNLYRDQDGRFSRGRIATAALGRPLSVLPGLMRFDRNCRRAAESLGEFLADCQL